MEKLQAELAESANQLNAHYPELRATARERPGSLFNPSDYPMTPEGLFGIALDYPNFHSE